MLDLIASWEADEGPIDREYLDWADAVLDRQGVESLIIDAGPFITDGERLHSRRAPLDGDSAHNLIPPRCWLNRYSSPNSGT